jgi:hypothetical protein
MGGDGSSAGLPPIPDGIGAVHARAPGAVAMTVREQLVH